MLGVVGLLALGVARLVPHVRAAELASPAELAATALFSALMMYAEGYRGFQKAFSPRVVARARWLGENPRPLLAALGPLFCAGLMHATPRRKIASWALAVGIAGLVLVVRRLPVTPRAIVDAGVVAGLSYGIGATLAIYGRSLLGRPPEISPDVPASAP